MSRLIAAVITTGLLAACGAATPEASTTSADDEPDYLYVIPAGTADRIRGGEAISIVPPDLTVQVGESIRIVNEDVEHHVVGIFHVGPGETLDQRFASAGEYEGSCTTNREGQFTLRVTE